MAKRILQANPEYATCRYSESDTIVKPGLTMTPAQVADLTNRGIAVSTQNASFVPESDINPDSWEVDLMHQRGSDLNELWQAERAARSKIVGNHKKDKKTYG